MVTYTPSLFKEKDPTCKFKKYLLEDDGKQCKKPYCEIGFFECQWIDNCIPCPLRWQWGSFDGWDNIPEEVKIKIVDNAKEVVCGLAASHSIDIPEVVTIFDLLDATRVVQEQIEGTETTDQTLESIAETLTRLGNAEKEKD